MQQLPQQSSSKEQLSLHIKQQTWSKFRSIYQKKYKKQYNQAIFTVLASITIVNRHNLQYKIISIGLGTKSLPHSILTQTNNKDLICDMHGEMLAILGFRRFLCEQIQKKCNEFLQWNEKKKKYSLKQEYEIYLYCSQIFCGDCCISKEEESYSGAKPLSYLKTPQYSNDKFKQNILRTKPGRIDLPMEKRSTLLSCSDLIALYNVVGIQGKKLFSTITPIYLSKIIIDCNSALQGQIHKGTNLIIRLHNILPRSHKLLHRQIFNIIVNGKQRQISSQFHHQIPELLINAKEQSRNRQGFQLTGIFTEEHQEWLNGKTGLPQGSSLANYSKKGKISKYSQANLQKDFPFYRINQHSFKYEAILQRVKKLFGEWIDGAGQ